MKRSAATVPSTNTSKDEIVIIDTGIQFPEEDTPGIDYIIPNVAYLQEHKDKIRGIFLTHGHYDHIAAIHYLVEKIGNPMIYTADFTKMMVEKRHQEFVNAPKLHFQVVKHGDHDASSANISKPTSSTVDHTIPDALGFHLHTPIGKMVSFGDFRLKIGRDGQPIELDVFKELGTQNVHTVFMDSTNALREGFSSSEKNVEDNLEDLIKGATGRVIVATFSTRLSLRLFEIVNIAERHGRKVAVNGRSMKDNLTISQQLGYFKPGKDLMIPLEDIDKYKNGQVVFHGAAVHRDLAAVALSDILISKRRVSKDEGGHDHAALSASQVLRVVLHIFRTRNPRAGRSWDARHGDARSLGYVEFDRRSPLADGVITQGSPIPKWCRRNICRSPWSPLLTAWKCGLGRVLVAPPSSW